MLHPAAVWSAALLVALTCAPSVAGAQVLRPAVVAGVAGERAQTGVPRQRGLPGGYRAPRQLPAMPPASLSAQRSALKGPMVNAVYGAIVAISGNVLKIQTRTGQIRTVDATAAYAAGMVSAPLFVGKLVVAEGQSRTDGVLNAARVSRLARIAGANADH